MRKIYLFSVWLLCCLNACIEDKGNYNYVPLEEVAISGLDDSYRFVLQKSQSITPKVITNIDESNLTYCWRIGPDTLCKTKDFNYTFTRIPVAVSSNPLTFEVRDMTTDVRYSKVMQVSVVSPFYSGWLMLTAQRDGKAALAFQSYEDEQMLYQDVYQEVNNEKLSGTPLMVKQLRYQDGITVAYMDRVSVVCKNGKSPELDGTSLVRCKYYEDEFKNESLHIDNITSEYYRNENALSVVSDGLVYGKVSGSMGSPDDAYYQYPFEGDERGYKVAPFLVKGAYTSYYFALDELNHRFVYYAATTLSSRVSSVVWNEEESVSGVDLYDVQGEMIWMGAILYDDDIYSIVLDKGVYVLRRMAIEWDGRAKLLACMELPAGVVCEGSCFALHPTSPYLFISNGNMLQAINLENLSAGAGAVNEIYRYEGEILAMHYAFDNSSKLDEFGIAIQTGENESALLIINPTLSSKGEIITRYDHVEGKVVSLYRKFM